MVGNNGNGKMVTPHAVKRACRVVSGAREGVTFFKKVIARKDRRKARLAVKAGRDHVAVRVNDRDVW